MKIKSIQGLKKFINNLSDDIKFNDFTSCETFRLTFTSKSGVVVEMNIASKKLKNKIDKLYHYIDNDEYEKGILKLKEIKKIYGDSVPDAVQAESMLAFLSHEKIEKTIK